MQINDMQFDVELEDVLDELRAQLHINGFPYLEKEPKHSGRSLQVQCPYHSDGQERNRSAGIRKSDGMFHCFACGEIHSLPELISYCFGKSDMMFGWKWLLKNFATVQIEERKSIELDFSRGVNNAVKHTTSFVTEEELDSYRFYHDYMYKRRLTDDIIEIFDIGYDRNTDAITFPCRNISGDCLFIARRSVKTKWFNYPKDVEKELYGIYEIYQLDTFPDSVIVTESMLDALTCWVYGKYAVALNGLGNELQMKQLKELPCRELIIATDNDKAGLKAREKIIHTISNKMVYYYDIPRIYRDNGKVTKDINDLEKEEFLNLKKHL